MKMDRKLYLILGVIILLAIIATSFFVSKRNQVINSQEDFGNQITFGYKEPENTNNNKVDIESKEIDRTAVKQEDGTIAVNINTPSELDDANWKEYVEGEKYILPEQNENVENVYVLYKGGEEINSISNDEIMLLNSTGTGKITMSSGANVIQNNGTLKIESGTIENKTTANAGISSINSSNTTISGGTVIGANGISVSGGNVTVSSGTITGTGANSAGIKNVSGSVTLGIKSNGAPSITAPNITGETYGLDTNNGFKFFDGILRGKTQATNGNASEVEPNYAVFKTKNVGYEEAYLKKNIVEAKLLQNKFTYTGNQIIPNEEVTWNGQKLTKDKDYTVKYEDNINVGTGKVTITGTGEYMGEVKLTFEITRLGIAVPTVADRTYTGLEQTGVAASEQYTIDGTNSATDAGKYTVKVTPTSNYQWNDGLTTAKEITWNILEKEIKVEWTETSFVYNGSAQIAKVKTPMEGVSGESVNITVTVSEPKIDAGTGYEATASIQSVTNGRARNENYKLTNAKTTFDITRANTNVTVSIEGENQVNKPLTLKANTVSDGKLSYQWWWATEASATSGTPIPNATGESYTPTEDMSGRYVGVTVNVAQGTNYNACSGYSKVLIAVANYKDNASQANYYTTLNEAFSNAQSGSTINLLKDNYTDASKAVLNGEKTITLNLDGKKLNKTASIINNGNMTLEGNGEIIAGPDVAELISNTGTLTIKKVTLTIKDNTTDYPRVVSQQGGTVTLDGGEIRSVIDGTPASTYKGSRGISMYGDKCIVNIKSGTIQMENPGYISLGIEICKDDGEVTSSINMTGGTIRGTAYGILIQKNATFKTTINVTGGEITSSNGCALEATTSNYAGTITIGNKDGLVSVVSPIIQGETYGINSTNGFNFYDGIFRGKNKAISGTASEVEPGYAVYTENNGGYEVAYLKKNIVTARLLEDNIVYTGSEIQPRVEVTWNGKVLEENKDYTVTYDNNINAGNNTAKVIIEGMGEYTGRVELPFTILKANITGDLVITGRNKYNYTLTADISGIEPDDCSFTFQWYYNDTENMENGHEIVGEEGMTFKVPLDLEGYYIYVVVVANRDNYNERILKDITDSDNNGSAKVVSNKLMAREEPDGDVYYVLGAKRAGLNDYTADKISRIIIKNNDSKPDGTVASWDVSRTEGANQVTAWVVNNGSDMYDLYIGADGIIMGIDGQNLFRDYINCTSISGLENITTIDMTDMSAMFKNDLDLAEIDVSSFNTSNVINMSEMFTNCNNVKSLDVSDWSTEKVTNMSSMFYECNELTSLDVAGFKTSNVESMYGMFYKCGKLKVIDVTFFDVKNVTDMSYMFTDCSSVESLNVGNMATTSKLAKIEFMFKGCAQISNIDMAKFDTSSITNMESLFEGCTNLSEVIINKLNTSNVTNMSNMFENCSSLLNIDVSGFNTEKVESLEDMFRGCIKLSALDLENFNTTSVTNMNNFLSGCTDLVSINLGANFDRLNGSSMFTDDSKLIAIITARRIASSDNAIQLGTDTGLESLPNAVLYVPDVDSETNYEAATNYNTALNSDRVRTILELLGEKEINLNINSIYNEAGVTVAGVNNQSDGTLYTQYGYKLSVTGLPVDTSNVGTITIVYTVTDRYDAVVMTVTRIVNIARNIVVDETEISTSNAKWSGWKLYGGANVDGNSTLNLTGSDQYAEKWFMVMGTSWSMGINFMATSDMPNKGFDVITEYYDRNFNPITADNGNTTDTLKLNGVYNTWSFENWNGNDGTGLNVEYVKVRISWSSNSSSPIKIKDLYFACNINDTYSGIRISVSAKEGSIDEIKYLWTKAESGVKETDITEVADNLEIVWPKYGSKGTYYLWTLVTNTNGSFALDRSEPIILDNVELELSNAGVSLTQSAKIDAFAFNKESIYIDDWRDPYNNGGSNSGTSVSEGLTSRFGSKAWNMRKSGTANEWQGMDYVVDALTNLKAGSYILVSSNYRTSDNASINSFISDNVLESEKGEAYSDVTYIAKELNIYDDNDEHHVFYLVKNNANISGKVKLSNGMPNWGYSNEDGSMQVDGLQWFVFSNENDIRSDIAVTKYAEGNKDIEYFRQGGIAFEGNSFNVSENGLYTVYVRSVNGVEKIKTIRVKNVDTDGPEVNIDLSGYIEGTRTGDDVSVIVTGKDPSAGSSKIEYSFDNKTWNSMLPKVNDNLLLNSDFYKLTAKNYDWNTLLNGNEMADNWIGFNKGVSDYSKGYHGHIDKNKFNSNVFALINKNSEFDLANRELSIEQEIKAGVIKAGTTYTLSFDMYAEDADCGITAGLRYYSDGSRDFHNKMENFVVSNDEVGHWVRRSYTFTTTDNLDVTKQSELLLFGNKLEVEGSMFVKNIKLEEGSEATDWTPNNLEQQASYLKGFVKFNKTMDETVYFKVTDAAGNETVVTKHIIIDKTAPSSAKVYINDDAAVTKDVEVVVHIESNDDDIKYMYISNEDDMPLYNEWVPYKEFSTHYLIPENGDRTVYVWLKDEAGNISNVMSDNITLSASYALRLISNQKYSGSEEIAISYILRADNEEYGSWQTSDTFKNLIPNVVYHAKTKLEETTGNKLSQESDEWVFSVVYNAMNELVIEDR